MNAPVKPQLYRDFIDDLVELCQHGQGQIGAKRVRTGFADQDQINVLLSTLGAAERQALERFGIAPFETGYEGSALCSGDLLGLVLHEPRSHVRTTRARVSVSHWLHSILP